MSQQWLNSFDEVNQALSRMQNDAKAASRKGGLSSRDKRGMKSKLNQCKNDLQALERQLGGQGSSMGGGEMQRRQDMVADAKNIMNDVDDLVNGSGSRQQLFSGTSGRTVQDDASTQNLSNLELMQQQQERMEQQDDQLDLILGGVTKLKTMSHEINSELDLHEHLLSDLDGAVDRTDAKMLSNIDNVDDLDRKRKGCMSIICMVILLALIVLLLIPDSPMDAIFG